MKYLLIILLLSCTAKEVKIADKEFKDTINKAEAYQKITQSDNISEIRESLFYCSEDLKANASETRKLKTQVMNLKALVKDYEDNQWKIDIVNYVLWGIGIIVLLLALKFAWQFRKFFGIPI